MRSCTAVSLDKDTCILVLHAEAYNAIMRHQHIQQRQLQATIAFIQELSLFKHINISTLTALASTVQHKKYYKQDILAIEAQIIDHVIIIVSGEIQAYESVHEHGYKKKNDMKTIRRVVNTMSKGKVIGQCELFKDLRHFEYTYEASTNTVDVMMIPIAAFLEAMKSIHFHDLSSSSSLPSSTSPSQSSSSYTFEQRKVKLADRTESAFDLIKNLIQLKSSNELVLQLPPISHHIKELCDDSSDNTNCILTGIESTSSSYGNVGNGITFPNTHSPKSPIRQKHDRYSFLFVNSDDPTVEEIMSSLKSTNQQSENSSASSRIPSSSVSVPSSPSTSLQFSKPSPPLRTAPPRSNYFKSPRKLNFQ